MNSVPGVTSCSVNLLTNSMGVEGEATEKAVIDAVVAAGYGASLKGAGQPTVNKKEDEEALEDHETPILVRRLLLSVGFLIVLMYFSMGHVMWGFPRPSFFDNNPIAVALTQLLLTLIVMYIT